MSDSNRFPIRRAAILIAIVAVLVPVTTRAAITPNPLPPQAGEPFHISFGGQWLFILVDETAPVVEVEGDSIRIVQDIAVPNILPVPEFYAGTAPIPPLPAGTYTVQLFGRALNTTAMDRVPVEERVITVDPASSIRAFQAHPALPSDYFISVTSRVRFEVEVFASCALLEPARVLADRRTIEVPVDRYCAILPPSPALVPLEMEEDLDLDAGTWTVRLVDDDAARTLATSTIEVLPYPVILRDGRFEVEVEWLDQDFPAPALPVSPPSEDSALFWFFEATNWELMLKVLDGCALNGHYWVFGAAQTDRGYRIRVRDTLSDATWEIENFAGTPSPAITDTTAFATCP